jgi:hypothetical protein
MKELIDREEAPTIKQLLEECRVRLGLSEVVHQLWIFRIPNLGLAVDLVYSARILRWSILLQYNAIMEGLTERIFISRF